MLLLGIFLLGIYLASLAAYRLWFSPIAHIPGPKIAALTSWYNGYHDLIRGGQYIWVVEEMHRKYGPIVRTRPDAVHVNDPFFIDEVYSQSPKRRREKFHTVLNNSLIPGSSLTTKNHEFHRRRRAALNPYFSQQNVRRLEPVLRSTLENLLDRMKRWAQAGQPVRLNDAYRATSKDVIQEYSFGEGERFLDADDCNIGFFAVMDIQWLTHLGTHMFWLFNILGNLPPAVMKILMPQQAPFNALLQSLDEQIERIKLSKEIPEGKTIFHDILLADSLPESEKSSDRLAKEAIAVILAGTETTAAALGAITFHMLADRSAIDRLRAELKTIMPSDDDLPDAAKLDKLPYLNAVINEANRLYPGASHRQDRLCPDEDLMYSFDGKTFRIPAGTGIGMTAPLVNRSTLLYERPDEFLPDRYIQDPTLPKFSMTFSKGSRQCLGINLAYEELRLFVAGIFRRYDLYDPEKTKQSGPTMELYKTDRRDIALHSDYFVASQYPGSQGLRVLIRD